MLFVIKNNLVKRIGGASTADIHFSPLKIKGLQILQIKCNKSEEQVFIDEKDTYVRMGPSTEKLVGPELAKFQKRRFS